MQLTIDHKTTYRYEEPVSYAVQRLRLTPQDGSTQRVSSWRILIEGGTEQAEFRDHFGNECQLVRLDHHTETVTITAQGQIETLSQTGVVGAHTGLVPLWLYHRSTPLTVPGPRVSGLVGELPGSTVAGGGAPVVDIAMLHELAALIAQRVDYLTGSTSATDTAEDALAAGHGVCQDHAHVFISAARKLGVPARYISGYLMMTDRIEQDASHAWAEAWVDPIGWVGFDPSNGVSPDERYVRIATGRDYEDAAPISGVRFGSTPESLEVSVQVEQ